MKIKTKTADYTSVYEAKRPKHRRPRKPNIFFRILIRLLSIPELIATRFSYTSERMEQAGKGPYFILMNHSCFLDLKIAYKIFFPLPFCVVCTSDGFVGKEWLMRSIGSIPAQKFVTDITLLGDILYTVNKLKTSILMYPEASYSFDGCPTPLQRGLGKLIKKLDIPVVTVITDGAFLHNPLYNCLRQRKTKVSAEVKCLLTLEEVRSHSAEEIEALLDKTFSFDAFASQYEKGTQITEDFRADGLERILYRCPSCNFEGALKGEGITLTCKNCGKSYELTTLGRLEAKDGNAQFPHIPDWYSWQRDCVHSEIASGNYLMDMEVDIAVMTDFKAIYKVGEGRLVHDINGFRLTGCDGKLEYTQGPLSCYGLYADYYWYEIGDVICIGNKQILYYCFPKNGEPVAKARLASEELYKITKSQTSKKQ